MGQQGFDGYYTELSPEPMTGLAFIGDPALDAAVAAAAAAAGDQVAAQAAPPAGTGNGPETSITDHLTATNVAIGGGVLVGAYLLYRFIKRRR